MIPGFRNPLSKEWPTPRPDDSRIWKQSSAEPNRRHARRNEIPVQADPTVLGELYALSSGQKDSTRRAWKIFKENPFDRRLRAHKIHRLSARYGRTIYAVEIEPNLRAVLRLIVRPLPCAVLKNVCAPDAVPTSKYEPVSMLPPIITGWPMSR